MRVDHKREIATYAARRGRFDLVEVPRMQFLMADGHGDPNTAPAYADALATMYPLAYGLKFHSRRAHEVDYTVMPLEALWWSDDMAAFTIAREKSRWSWTLLMMVPDHLGADDLAVVRAAVARKRGAPVLDAVRLEPFDEGLAVQTLHVGPYDDEGPVLRALHDDVIPAQGLRMTGHHHEVYLGDPRRTAPERLRTILRQPVVRA